MYTKPDKHLSGARKIPHAGHDSQHLPAEILVRQCNPATNGLGRQH
jgi:hypothetical protein